MNLSRRGAIAAGAALAFAPLAGHASGGPTPMVTLLHTNDTHSRLVPFENGKLAGQGGIARRASLIRQIRREQPHTLVLDAGDIFQGTPYYNVFGGRAEFETMTAAGYDLATLGNHDFDRGVDGLLEALPAAGFTFVNSNFDIDVPVLRDAVKPYAIREVAGRRIGFFGLGVKFELLVAAAFHKGVRYREPVAVARQMVERLRRGLACDAVILISHLGYFGFESEPGDIDLATAVPGIDVIVGGHTHTFLDVAHVVTQKDGTQTSIVQVGSSGTHLGRVDLHFGPQSRPAVAYQPFLVTA